MVKVNDRVRLIPEFEALDVPMAGTVVREVAGGDVVVRWDSGQEARFDPEALAPTD